MICHVHATHSHPLCVFALEQKTSARQSILSFFSNQLLAAMQEMMVLFFAPNFVRARISWLRFSFTFVLYVVCLLCCAAICLKCSNGIGCVAGENRTKKKLHTRNYIVQHGLNEQQANAEEAEKYDYNNDNSSNSNNNKYQNLLKRTQCDWQFEIYTVTFAKYAELEVFARSPNEYSFERWNHNSHISLGVELPMHTHSHTLTHNALVWWKSIIHFVFHFPSFDFVVVVGCLSRASIWSQSFFTVAISLTLRSLAVPHFSFHWIKLFTSNDERLPYKHKQRVDATLREKILSYLFLSFGFNKNVCFFCGWVCFSSM